VLQAVLERAVIPEHKRQASFLIVDEATAYFDSNMDDFLTEARTYKCGCVDQFFDGRKGCVQFTEVRHSGIQGQRDAPRPRRRTQPGTGVEAETSSFRRSSIWRSNGATGPT